MSSVKEEISQMNTSPDIFVLDSTLVESPSVEGGYRFSVSRRRDDFALQVCTFSEIFLQDSRFLVIS